MIHDKLNEKVRQLKDPNKEILVVKDGKVMVIDKEDLKKFEKDGWMLAEDSDLDENE